MATPKEANQAVRLVLGSYPNRNIPDAEVYVRQIVALLCEYPVFVAEQIAHPTRGIVADHPFLPSLSEIKAFADGLVVPRRARRDRLHQHLNRMALPAPEYPSAEERARGAERARRAAASFGTADPVAKTAWATAFPRAERRMTEGEAQAQLERDRIRALAECQQMIEAQP